MLLPISHEKMSVRRVPIVTVAIIVVTVLLHGLASVGASAREERGIAAMLAARLLYLQRPSLGICEPLRPFVSAVPSTPSFFDPVEKGDDEITEHYQAACHDLAEAFEGLPAYRFGYVPARANLPGLVTHLFVHADWWHVLGNMWFLFLCGLALEDRWGRLPFAAYYVIGGVVAAGVHHLLVGNPNAALIGASGAVAAAMGAFLVLFATTKIRFVGFFAFRVFSFMAPAYVMLPMWAGVEILYGVLARSSGTAHWAHVGGFAFGAAVAGIFRTVGVDRKLDDAVERAAVLGNDPRVDAARALVAKGEAAQAAALLEGLAKEKPESSHVWEALRDAARAGGDTELADHAARQMASIEVARLRGERLVPERTSGASPSVPPVRSSSPAPAAPRASRPSVRVPSTSVSVVAPSVGVVAPAVRAPEPAAPDAAPFFPAPPRKE